jgi:hypothetical protein
MASALGMRYLAARDFDLPLTAQERNLCALNWPKSGRHPRRQRQAIQYQGQVVTKTPNPYSWPWTDRPRSPARDGTS